MLDSVRVFLNTARPKNRHDNWHVVIRRGNLVELHRFASEEEARTFAENTLNVCT